MKISIINGDNIEEIEQTEPRREKLKYLHIVSQGFKKEFRWLEGWLNLHIRCVIVL